MHRDLFSEDCVKSNKGIQIDMPDADVCLYPAIFSLEEADLFFRKLKHEIVWQQEQIEMYGQIHQTPRLSAWYGDEFKSYTYSGITSHPRAWTDNLLKIKQRVASISSHQFNSVLLNLYRTGADSVAWHSDDEPELGREPVIASVSFGQARSFQMKHKTKVAEKQKILLSHGDLLIMKGKTQQHWFHQIPKSKRSMQARINLTFRVVL